MNERHCTNGCTRFGRPSELADLAAAAEALGGAAILVAGQRAETRQ